MPKFELSVNLPKGVDLIRLQFSETGWEATCVAHATVDRYDVAIPAQFGQVFRQHTPGKAIELAGVMARDKSLALKAKRNAAQDPRLSPEEQLLKQLGLI